MRSILSTVSALILLPTVVLASTSQWQYSDTAPDAATASSVNDLTERGIVEGNPDGTFRANDLVNRAEFTKIAMSVRESVVLQADPIFPAGCFPDVSSSAWFAPYVCAAKQLGIVRGNERPGVDPSDWYFEPSRPVQYEEALKILFGIFAFDLEEPAYVLIYPSPERYWYDIYMWNASRYNVALELLQPGHQLTRGEISRLVVNFIDVYESQPNCKPIVCSNGDVHPTCTEDGHQINYFAPPCLLSDNEEQQDQTQEIPQEEEQSDPVTYDPNADYSVTSAFVLLGKESPVLGSARIFMDSEPLIVTKLIVKLTSLPQSIDFIDLYDEDRVYLGRATRDSSEGSTHFSLPLKTDDLLIPRRTSYSFYARAKTKAYNAGGVSGETIRVDTFTVQGDGDWSNSEYSQSTSETYNGFMTSRARIIDISNGSATNDVIVSGTGIPLGSFRLEGELADGASDLEISDLTITVEQNGGVTVSNVELGANDTNERFACSIASYVVTCSSIPPQFTAFGSSVRTITFYGDVDVPSDEDNVWMRLKINAPGNVSSAGDVTWTDGDATFTWVASGTPVATSTYFSR